VTRFLIALIRLFPAPFRERFGEELAAEIREEHERAALAGWAEPVWYVTATAFDLVRSAISERFDPTWLADDPNGLESEGMGWLMSGWTKDFRYAARALRRTPGFAAIAIGTLALAIGANAGIFSVVDTVLLNPLPFPESDRLVYIAGSAPGSDLPEEFGHTIREDGHYIEAGENDNLIVQKLGANPTQLGIFGYSFLDQNLDKVQGSKINGVAPEFDAISDGSYSISRPLYFYVKTAHVDAIQGIREFLQEFTGEAASGEFGYLSDKGLIPLQTEERVVVAARAMKLEKLNLAAESH
jgi:hypothetical protein